jgi:hypothetical protein
VQTLRVCAFVYSQRSDKRHQRLRHVAMAGDCMGLVEAAARWSAGHRPTDHDLGCCHESALRQFDDRLNNPIMLASNLRDIADTSG